MMSFGSTAVDSRRPSADFPGLSLLTGILAAALGWTHHSHSPLAQRLQERVRYAARNESLASGGSSVLTDFQTAQLDKDDVAWSTTGIAETRTGGSASTYRPPYIRSLEYRTNLRTTVALSLEPQDEAPTPPDLAHALQFPETILFIGRKTCLPSEPMMQGLIEAESALQALALTPSVSFDDQDPIQWDGKESHPLVSPLNEEWTYDIRDWANGIHTGRRQVTTGLMARPQDPMTGDAAP